MTLQDALVMLQFMPPKKEDGQPYHPLWQEAMDLVEKRRREIETEYYGRSSSKSTL